MKKISRILVLALMVLAVASCHKKAKTYSGETISVVSETIDETEKEAIKSPKDCSPYDATIISLNKLKETNSYEIKTTGTSTASVFGVKTTIDISNTRTVVGSEAMITCISAGMISSGSQRYFNDSKVYLRKGKVDKKTVSATFDDTITPEVITNDEYINRYGWLPFQVFGYIVNKDTLKEDITIKENDNKSFDLKIALKPDSDAAFYYKREIGTNAKSPKEPEFVAIDIEININESFVINTVKFEEEYKVVSGDFSFVGAVDTKTSLTDTYNYTDVKFNEDYYKYFKNKISES